MCCKRNVRRSHHYADKCTYAHQEEKLMPRPNLLKTQMCARFLSGCCINNGCPHAHRLAELSQGKSKSNNSNESFNPHQEEELMPRPNLLNTKMCVSFLSGGCINKACPYAHGLAELSQGKSKSKNSNELYSPSRSRGCG